MSPILNRSPLATLCFTDGNGLHIRVYYQDTDGNIRETCYDDNVGWKRRSEDVVGNGKLNTGISAICWDNGTQIRVFFLSPENQVVERCYTGGAAGSWSDGSLTTKKKFMAAPYSQISAVGFGSGLKDIRVYYQDATTKLREIVLDVDSETWVEGTNDLPVATPGTSISATANAKTQYNRIWVYYQQQDMKIGEMLMKVSGGSWARGTFALDGTYAPGAYISNVNWNNLEARIFVINDANIMTSTTYTNNTWQKTVELPTVITDSAVAAVKLTNNDTWIRVYCQPSGNLISERGSNDGGKTWVTMQKTLPIDN